MQGSTAVGALRLLVAVFCVCTVSAARLVWRSAAGSQDLFSASLWSGGVLPSADDDCVVDGSALIAAGTTLNLEFGSLTLLAGSRLTVAGAVVVGALYFPEPASALSSALVLSGATARLNVLSRDTVLGASAKLSGVSGAVATFSGLVVQRRSAIQGW
jgi:hypothetical protein